jgi:hypothetical protein
MNIETGPSGRVGSMTFPVWDICWPPATCLNMNDVRFQLEVFFTKHALLYISDKFPRLVPVAFCTRATF